MHPHFGRPWVYNFVRAVTIYFPHYGYSLLKSLDFSRVYGGVVAPWQSTLDKSKQNAICTRPIITDVTSLTGYVFVSYDR